MGGKLILAQVTSEGVKRSTKIGTWFLSKMNSVDILNEKYFNEFAEKHSLFQGTTESKEEHNDYENDKGMFAPYFYGILLIDFKDKKVFSCNNYNGFLIFGISNVKNDYEKIGMNKQEKIKIIDMKGNENEVSIFEENEINLPTPRIIESCIRNKGTMYVDGKKYIIKEKADYFSVAAQLYGKDLNLCSKEEAKEYIKNKGKNHSSEFSLKDWQNIEIKVGGWEIINGDGTFHFIKSAYDYYSTINMLSEKEKEIWIDELSEKEKNQEESEIKVIK